MVCGPGGMCSSALNARLPVIKGSGSSLARRRKSSIRPLLVFTFKSMSCPPGRAGFCCAASFTIFPYTRKCELPSTASTGSRYVSPLVPSTCAWNCVCSLIGLPERVRRKSGVSVTPSTARSRSTPWYFPCESSIPAMPWKVDKSAWLKVYVPQTDEPPGSSTTHGPKPPLVWIVPLGRGLVSCAVKCIAPSGSIPSSSSVAMSNCSCCLPGLPGSITSVASLHSRRSTRNSLKGVFSFSPVAVLLATSCVRGGM